MTTDDPRLDAEYVRRCPGADDAGDVLLVGVVHDHPASEFRVRELITADQPDVLALELAPLAIPLFEQYAEESDSSASETTSEAVDDDSTADAAHADDDPPVRGGEMSVAIDAAATDRIEPIDGPSRDFLASLVATLYREDATLTDVRRVLVRFTSISRHVLHCRLAALVGLVRGKPPAVDAKRVHETSWQDPPEVQAADERTQIRKAVSILNAFETPSHAKYRDETREAYMADRLASLRDQGDVVAVVGMGHLDAVCDRLDES